MKSSQLDHLPGRQTKMAMACGGVVAQVAMGSSIVLAAEAPESLARFYGALLAVEPRPGLAGNHWLVAWPAGGWLELYAPGRNRPQPRQQGRLALCLKRECDGTGPLASLEAWIATSLVLGATLLAPARLEPFGAEAWLLDPEGNRLLLLVAAPIGKGQPIGGSA